MQDIKMRGGQNSIYKKVKSDFEGERLEGLTLYQWYKVKPLYEADFTFMNKFITV